MIRRPAASSLQKTYDECYLICSTAIYFEGQNNEAEALRSWRNALDQIYYHNAYKMPSNYSPRTETEKALHDSLRAMELQCKERVDLLDTLRQSRLEAEEEGKMASNSGPSKSRESLASTLNGSPSSPYGSKVWLGGDTIPQASYEDLPRPSPLPDRRPPLPPPPPHPSQKLSGQDYTRANSWSGASIHSLPPASGEKPRTPSPDKKAGAMLKTLRSNPKDRKLPTSMRNRPPPAASKAASSVWSGSRRPSAQTNGNSTALAAGPAIDPSARSKSAASSRASPVPPEIRKSIDNSVIRPPSPSDFVEGRNRIQSVDDTTVSRSVPPPYPDYPVRNPSAQAAFSRNEEMEGPPNSDRMNPPPPPPHKSFPTSSGSSAPISSDNLKAAPTTLSQAPAQPISYMKEYPQHPPKPPPPAVPPRASGRASDSDGPPGRSSNLKPPPKSAPGTPRRSAGRAVGVVSATTERQKLDAVQTQLQERRRADPQSASNEPVSRSADPASRKNLNRKPESKPAAVRSRAVTPPSTDDSPDTDDDDDASAPSSEQKAWDMRVARILKKLPRGVDEAAAKQIFNEIVIKGDEVHWDDVAGLEIAKSALKETVVYPFLRPDLFMGLREPARGMLLFGPPGTGKTMLARAVATESKSVFFAISASSLTSKFLGESEKLVRALFALAKELAPSIIFVDEIDSLLGSRGGSSEHEATRRIKTEFLIGWSDLQKAAAGRDADKGGDATRVLVLAATNMPWAIDEAARRRFVRRQYIPLPEDWVREKQLRTLLAAQKHSLSDRELKQLVRLTDGFSGSDITALAKDAAMGPLRALGEQLLHMTPDDIRPIGIADFQASLDNIRPSVSKQGLKEFEDWATQFGERGG